MARGAGAAAGAAFAALAAGLAAAPAHAQLHAERLHAGNLAALRVAGPDADGGLGDWALGNGTLCAVVSDADHESHLATRGGILVDLAHCGRAEDQWSALQPLPNLSPREAIPIRSVRAEREAGEARIRVEGEGAGLRMELVYALGAARPGELRVRARVERVAEGPRLFALGWVALHSSGQLRPFTLSTRTPERSPGFAHPEVDTDSVLSLVRGLVPADAHVLVGGDRVPPGVAYGLRIAAARRERGGGGADETPVLHVSGADFTLMGALARPPWIGAAGEPPGWLSLAQMPLMDLAVGDALALELVIWLGGRGDVASAGDVLLADAPRVVGRVDDPDARVHVRTAGGAPVTQVRPGADGALSFRLPAGRYEATALAPGGRRASRTFEVSGDGGDLGRIAVGAPARVVLPRGETLRLVFRGRDGTPDPRLGDDLLGFRTGEREVRASPLTSTVSLAGIASDPPTVTLPPGRYRVIATRGPEFDVSEASLELGPGETEALAIAAPERAFQTPGWIAADLHVHSGHSFDSSLPLADQARAFAAQGAEVLVSTEHDRVVDPRPVIAALGLAERVAGVVGVEVTTTVTGGESPHTIGHSNAFPLTPRPDAYRGGAPRAEGRRLRHVLADLRRDAASPLLQLNHPRPPAGRSGGLYYLSHLAVAGEPYDPALPLRAFPNRVLIEPDPESGLRDLDFQAMELVNGTELGSYRRLLADWTSLLLQGERRTATANSDSHHAWEVVGIPRSYVRVPDDRPGALDPAAFAAAVREGLVVGTTGPLLDAHLEGPGIRHLAAGAASPGDAEAVGIGGLASGSEGTLVVDVRAAPWVPVSGARVLVNGDAVVRRPLPGPGPFRVPLRFAGDAFVVVEVSGPAEGVYAELLPGTRPLAFTNPIFVDADGDGRFTPPGLSDPLPDAIREAEDEAPRGGRRSGPEGRESLDSGAQETP